MAIDARKKFGKIIEDSLNASKAELVAQREIKDVEELYNLLGIRSNLSTIRADNEVVRVSAVEERYSNGLTLLKLIFKHIIKAYAKT